MGNVLGILNAILQIDYFFASLNEIVLPFLSLSITDIRFTILKNKKLVAMLVKSTTFTKFIISSTKSILFTSFHFIYLN